MRYNSFFLESCCAVLFYDILWHPSKHSYNLEFIQMTLRALETMVPDDPVANARRSIQRILRVVEQTISKRQDGPSQPFLGSASPPQGQLPLVSSTEDLAAAQNQQLHSGILFPSLNTHASASDAGDLIYFSDHNHQQPELSGPEAPGNLPLEAASAPGAEQDPGGLFNLSFDVLTTDLYNLFPLQITTPEDGYNHYGGGSKDMV